MKFIEEIKRLGMYSSINGLKSKSRSKKDKELYINKLKELLSLTNYLPDDTTQRMRLNYLRLVEDNQNIKCPVPDCCNFLKWNSSHSSFFTTCNIGDTQHKEFITSKRLLVAKNTSMKKYGTEYYGQSKAYKKNLPRIREKYLKTINKNHGVNNFGQSDQFKENLKDYKDKATETCLKKYYSKHYTQSEHYLKNKEIYIAKYKETCLLRYGVEHYAKSDESKKKYKETCLIKYGVDNYAQTDESKKKYKETCLMRYGVSNYTQTDEFRQQVQKISPQTNDIISQEERKKLLTIELLEFLTPEQHIKVSEIITEYKCSETTAYKIFRDLGIETKKRNGSSIAEDEIVSYIREQYPDLEIIRGTRSIIGPQEIDIYLPELKLAIEYNGIMFHTAGTSKYNIFNTPDFPKDYHLQKTLACEALDIQLIHIREDEYLMDKQSLMDELKFSIDYQLGDIEITEVNLTEETYIVPRDKFKIDDNIFIDVGRYRLQEVLSPREILINDRIYTDSGMLVYVLEKHNIV